eukprot:scaffold135817_cov30-Tisochrysis_lutea.AAC.2
MMPPPSPPPVSSLPPCSSEACHIWRQTLQKQGVKASCCVVADDGNTPLHKAQGVVNQLLHQAHQMRSARFIMKGANLVLVKRQWQWGPRRSCLTYVLRTTGVCDVGRAGIVCLS